MKRARTILTVVALVIVAPALLAAFVLRIPSPDRRFLPFGTDRSCAVAVTDDTDDFQFASTDPVYDLLDSLDIRVTKTIWIFDAPGRDPERHGLSWENATYRSWVREKMARGHEITLHSATSGHDTRKVTLAAFDSIRAITGDYPRVEIFHTTNREAIYWGAKRIPNRLARSLYLFRSEATFEGDESDSPYYWLDVSRRYVRYLRTYTSNDLDTWALNPSMPYEDSRTPQAPLWFASCNGRTGTEFVSLFAEEKVEKLRRDHGAAVVYTHFATDFARGPEGRRKRVRADVRETLTRLAADPTIEFVPAGELLDRLRLLQFVKAAVDDGLGAIEAPAVLRGVESDASVVSDAGRLTLTDWLRESGMRIEWRDDLTVFDRPVEVGWRERWRMVGRWVLTQFQTPT